MTRSCPICSAPLPPQTRARFCPRCSLRGALELSEDDAVPPNETSRIIGDYELLEQLGRGGMGVVYRAQQKSLSRFVAVKVLLAGEFADETARRRFHAEASAAARLRHPHIVAIHEIGEHEGQPFFSMELIEGRTFADLVRDGPLPPVAAARLLQPIVDAVQFAHEQGVLHRDLKPSNLLLDAFGHPRVSDFGLARRLDTDERFTLTGEVLGSPSYLAPEQARGERAQEAATSDVYSLGAILYHLITGRPPFLGESPQVILRQVIESEPLSPRKLNPAVPADLETICLKCLEKDPARRYLTARELSDELNRFLQHEPLRARSVGIVGRSWRWTLRHPAKAGLVAALALTFLTLAVVPTVAYLRIHRAEKARLDQLRKTLLAHARALRLGGGSGYQREGWAALTEAARLDGNSGDTNFVSNLRREAIANLALNDAWISVATNLPHEPDATLLRLDRKQKIVAQGTFQNGIKFFHVGETNPFGELPITNRTLQHIVDFTPDQRFLATRHKNQITFWDWKNKAEIFSETARLSQFSFRADSQAVAFLRSNSVVGFALPSGQKIWEWNTANDSERATLAFAPKNNWLALGLGGERGVEICEENSGAVLRRLSITTRVTSLAWSDDARWLATGGEDGTVNVWELSGVTENPSSAPELAKWSFATHGSFIHALAISQNQHWLAAAGDDEIVRLFNLRTGRTGMIFSARAFSLEFSPDSSRVGPVWQSGRPCWIKISDSPVFQAARLAPGSLNPTVAVDKNGTQTVAANSQNIFVFQNDFAQPPLKIPFPNSRFARFAKDGSLVTFSGSDSARWRFGFGINDSFVRENFLAAGGENAMFSANYRTVALACYRKNAALVFRDGKLLHELPHPRADCVALSPDGKKLVSTSLDLGETFLWEVETGKQISQWPDDGGNHVAFSPDGQWLAQFGPRCVIRETKTWRTQKLLENVAPNSSTCDGGFSPDGKMFAVIMADREVHLLSVPSFTPLAVLTAPSANRLHRLAWSADGETLAVLAAQNEVQKWNLRELRNRLVRLHSDF